MKIFQPIVSGSFTTSGSVFLKGLTSSAQSNVILINTTSGQLFYTASSALGGGGGSAITVKDEGNNITTTLSSLNFVGNGVTASAIGNAVTVSITGAGGSTFPYIGTAVITGSLVITETLRVGGSLTDYSTVNSTIVGVNNLYTQATGSYTSAFVKYTVSKGANSRAGEFITNWNGTTVTYFDNSTTDIGNTSDIVLRPF